MTTHAKRAQRRSRSKKLYCHGPSCGEQITKGCVVKCKVCEQPFCSDCMPSDRTIMVCDDCLLSLVDIKLEELKPAKKATQEGLLTDAKEKLKRIGTLKGLVDITRNALRAEVDDVRDICESLDRGVEEIDIGIRSLVAGLDAISELV